MIRKIVLFILGIVMILSMCACSSQGKNAETQASQTETESTVSQLHTLAQPRADDSVEWTHVNGEVTINDKETGEVILTKDDMKAFALIGSTNNDACFEMILTDTGKEILKSMGTKEFSMYVDGEKLCDFTYEENEDGAFFFGMEYSYEMLCKYATGIRGLD